MEARPQLTFFCELEATTLTRLFTDRSVVGGLLRLKAKLSLAILDFSEDRAEVVRRLNEAGVPVIAWLLLPKSEGYWFNMANAPAARTRYLEFLSWSRSHQLRWHGIGVDFEPDIHEVEVFLLGRRARVLWRALRRLGGRHAFEEAVLAHGDLVARMRADGFRVESYHLPILADDRGASCHFLRRLLGVLDVPVDLEVLMLYSSLVPRWGAGILGAYGPDAEAIGVGITGGGVELPGLSTMSPLTWEELSRDLRLAACWTGNIHVFSLEGCIKHGYWDHMVGFDWSGDAAVKGAGISRCLRFRRVLSLLLWIVRHRGWLFAGVLLVGLATWAIRVAM